MIRYYFRFGACIVVLIAAFAASAPASAQAPPAAKGDAREAVALSPSETEAFLAGMRTYLETIQGIVAAMLDRAMRRIPIEIWGDGSVMRDFIYVEDVAAAFVTAAVHAGPSRIFNIGSGEGRSIASVAGDIGRLEELGAVECAFRAGRAADVPVNVLDIARAHQELGWAPRTGWMDGLAGTLRWLRGS